jgi:hypothetical protein
VAEFQTRVHFRGFAETVVIVNETGDYQSPRVQEIRIRKSRNERLPYNGASVCTLGSYFSRALLSERPLLLVCKRSILCTQWIPERSASLPVDVDRLRDGERETCSAAPLALALLLQVTLAQILADE